MSKLSDMFDSAKGLNLPTDFWDLLSVGIGGGVIGRSAEKISTAISENLPNVGKRR